MKAFILAAGHGTRLRPLTEHTPKCLLPIQGVPLLEIWLEQCRNSGITDVLVNAHAHAEQVIGFARRQQSRVRVRVSKEKELLGSAGTLATNREFVAEEEDFFVLYGDVLTNVHMLDLRKFHGERKPAAATLGVYEATDPARCGVVELDQLGTVQSFVEKPGEPKSNLAFTGIMMARQEIFQFIPEKRPADIGFDLLPKLVGRMAAMKISGYLRDIGTMENYQAAQTDWPGLSRTASC
jgi:mannose-1-phosphate guanylyltransferase